MLLEIVYLQVDISRLENNNLLAPAGMKTLFSQKLFHGQPSLQCPEAPVCTTKNLTHITQAAT